MRLLLAAIVTVCCWLAAEGQEAPNLNQRYNLVYDSFSFPQETPKETMGSVVKAIKDRKVDYLLAHLMNPDWVDEKVQKDHAGKFAGLVSEVKKKLTNDPEVVKQLERFAKEGEWEMDDTTASARLPNLKERVYFRKIRFRWFLENRKEPAKEKEDKGQ